MQCRIRNIWWLLSWSHWRICNWGVSFWISRRLDVVFLWVVVYWERILHDLRIRSIYERSVLGKSSCPKYIFCPVWILVYLPDSRGIWTVAVWVKSSPYVYHFVRVKFSGSLSRATRVMFQSPQVSTVLSNGTVSMCFCRCSRCTHRYLRCLTVKFANAPPCVCRGSGGQNGSMTLAYQRFTAVLMLIYGSLFLSSVYYFLSVSWCAVARIPELELEYCLWGSF
jgi:hypothetical protein